MITTVRSETPKVPRTLAPGVSVLDEVLSPDAFKAIAQHFAGSRYGVTATGSDYWKVKGEEPHEARKILYLRPCTEDLRARFAQKVTVGPGEAKLDDLFRIIFDAAAAAAIIDTADEEWGGAVAIPYSFGPGARTNWHVDSGPRPETGPYYGAFVFYTHTTWHHNWGGELLFSDEMDDDFGNFIVPKSNRLVLIRGGTPHSVTRIAQNAGSKRRALTGFFFRRSGVEVMVSGEGLG